MEGIIYCMLVLHRSGKGWDIQSVDDIQALHNIPSTDDDGLLAHETSVAVRMM